MKEIYPHTIFSSSANALIGLRNRKKKRKTRTVIEVEGKKVSDEISNCLFEKMKL